MSVHVSIHDVSPAFRTEFESALALAHAAGIKPALLVVPNFHDEAPLDKSPEFVRRLQSLAHEGHEIILHGFFHRADTPGNLFRQQIVSGGEAEFSSIDKAEAAMRLDRGLLMFQDLGLDPIGFIAPAWSFAPWLLPLLRARRIRYTEDHFFSYDVLRGIKQPNLLLNYATRTHERMLTTGVFNRMASRLSLCNVPTRFAIHPKDMHFLVIRREVERMLALARDVGSVPSMSLI
jgi:uncharacterized protein